MDEPGGFVMEEGLGHYRPIGSVSFDEAVSRVRAAIAMARSQGARKLLVDTTALTGFLSPDTFQRYFAAVAWAVEAAGSLRLALVARAEMIDPQKFGVTVAANRGLTCDVFTTEAQARAWLDAKPVLGP